jgi:hypothetical protein
MAHPADGLITILYELMMATVAANDASSLDQRYALKLDVEVLSCDALKDLDRG